MKQYIPILLSLALIGCSAPVTAHNDNPTGVEDTSIDASNEADKVEAKVEQVTQQQVKEQLSKSEQEYCNSLYTFAETVMTVRQGGMSLKDALDSQPKPSSTATQAENEMLPLLQTILYEAYKQPLYHTEEYKKEVISEFSKDVYLACIGD